MEIEGSLIIVTIIMVAMGVGFYFMDRVQKIMKDSNERIKALKNQSPTEGKEGD